MSATAKHANRWDRVSVAAAMRQFHAETGLVPTANGWKRGGPRPSYNAVRRVFGSWTDAVETAGFERPARGRFSNTDRGELGHRNWRNTKLRFWRRRPHATELEQAQRACLENPLLAEVVADQIAEQMREGHVGHWSSPSLDAPHSVDDSRTLYDRLWTDSGFVERVIDRVDARREIDGYAASYHDRDIDDLWLPDRSETAPPDLLLVERSLGRYVRDWAYTSDREAA